MYQMNQNFSGLILVRGDSPIPNILSPYDRGLPCSAGPASPASQPRQPCSRRRHRRWPWQRRWPETGCQLVNILYSMVY